MQPSHIGAVALAFVLVLAGCTAAPGDPMSNDSTTPTPSTPSSTPTATPVPVESLPSPAECLRDTAPRPGTVDGVEPSSFPEPPGEVTRDSLVAWTQDFETAYFRNSLLAEEPGDDDHNLTEVSAYAETRRVNHTSRGYVLVFSDSGARNYASGLHSDRWMDVGYVVNETHVVRVPLADGDDAVRAAEGVVVIGCR